MLLRYCLRNQAGLTCKHMAIQIQGWNMVTWTSEKTGCNSGYRQGTLQRPVGPSRLTVQELATCAPNFSYLPETDSTVILPLQLRGMKGQTWRVRPSHKQSKVIFYQRVAPKRKWCATPLFTYSNQGIFKQKGGRIWRGGGEKKSPCLELICFPNIFPTVAPLSLLPSTFHSLPELRSKKGIHERSSGTQESESRYISSFFSWHSP